MTKRFYIASTIFFSCSLVFSLNSKAQNKPAAPARDTSRNAVTEEVEVVRSYKPVLADAVKIRRSPDLNDTKPFNPRVTYHLLDKRLELNSGIRELEAQKLAEEMEEQRKNNFAKAALGNLGTTLAQLNIATGQDEALQAGFNFNHLSLNGKLNEQKISRQGFSAYGRSIGDAIVLEGKLGYDRKSLFFYGVDPDGSFTNANPEKQKFNNFEGEGLLFNRTDADDESSFTYAAKINASIFNNGFAAKENNILFSGGLGKDFSKFHLGANGMIDFTTSEDSLYNFKNHLFKLNPFIQINTEVLRFTGGINYVNEFGSNQRIHLFPAASLDFMLIKNYLTVFGSFGGDVNKTRLKDLSDSDPYLNKNIELRNAVSKFDLAGGIRGTVAPNVGYKAMVSYQTVEDFSYFINNIDEPQKFDVNYMNGNTNILGFTGELNLNFSDAFNLDSKLELKSYDIKTEQYAWLHPNLTLTSNASFQLGDKIRVEGDLLFQGETKAKILTRVPAPPGSDILSSIKTIKAFADVSAGVEYQFNKQVSGFFKVNNILGTEYQRFPYYPNYGLNILGGVTYGF